MDKIYQKYRDVFNTPDGQIVLDDLRQRLFGNGTTFNPNNPCHLTTTFNEGQRSVILMIDQMMTFQFKPNQEDDYDRYYPNR